MTDTPPAAPGETPMRVYGFCWFHRPSYVEARSLMTDPEAMPEGFDEWLKTARGIERQITERGDKVIRIGFDPKAFLLFCVTRGTVPNEQARAQWAATEARRRYRGH
jgi:hypothetical protein